MEADVRVYVAACSICARGKATHQSPSELLQPLPVPSHPWSHVALDFVTGLPMCEGNDTILTIVDRFSKSVHYIALSKLPMASETADLLVQHVWKTFCSALGASFSLSSGFHPQSNGQTERANQDKEASLRCVAAQHPPSWAKYLPWNEYAHNSLTTSATGLSPFEVALGYQPPLFLRPVANSG